ncbi:unnamed protein product [Prorocentrum cordatum]|uniref:Uncharacterized protein n=1 Tax=Prorocentrum cordatum TaxID=2364126 RepID=A0ABN9XPJ3_9DINO|nr:unnamed protein product [Polarella glacialis]
MFDPLALLSDGEASAEEEPGATAADRADHANNEPASASSKRKLGSIAFDDLESAGYKPADLLTSASYLHDAAGQEGRKPKRHARAAEEAVHEKEEADDNI